MNQNIEKWEDKYAKYYSINMKYKEITESPFREILEYSLFVKKSIDTNISNYEIIRCFHSTVNTINEIARLLKEEEENIRHTCGQVCTYDNDDCLTIPGIEGYIECLEKTGMGEILEKIAPDLYERV